MQNCFLFAREIARMVVVVRSLFALTLPVLPAEGLIMEINCAFAPTLATPDHIALAEEIGFDRAWVYDVPLAFADSGIALAAAAERTTKIRLGVSVFTPHLRHIATNAGLIAHLATIAPGRFDAGFGVGFTSAAFLGRKPVKWNDLEKYVAALRTLLEGKEVEWDGSVLSLMHTGRTGISYPIDVPIWIAAHGPKGFATAMRLGAGVVTARIHGKNPVPFEGKCQLLFAGTILDDDETFDSPRVLDAAGPGACITLHLGEFGPLAGTAQAAGYASEISAIDESRRHLELHRGHLIEPNAIDRRYLDGEVIRLGSTSGSPVQVATALAELERAGATAVLYQPGGSDIGRELRSFYKAAQLRREFFSDGGNTDKSLEVENA